MTDDNPFLLPANQRQIWTECAYTARACELTLARLPDPLPGSDLACADTFYPWEKVSAWVRCYLRAAAEHLCLWADIVAPYRFETDAVNNVRIRPYLTLARAGMEGAAQALWLVEVPDGRECAKRFLRLMYRDFDYHRKALQSEDRDTSTLTDRIDVLKSRVAEYSIPVDLTDPVPGYGAMVRMGAKATGHDPGRWSYLWNAASAASHGQNWLGAVAYDVVPIEEYEPGHYRTLAFPDPTLITETVEAACDALQWGTLRWLLMGRHDATTLNQTTAEVHRRMPKIERGENSTGGVGE